MDRDLDQRFSVLMTQAQGGDRRAYEELLTEVAPLIGQFARRRLRQPEACEEIVQDTLLSIHRDRHTYDPARPFRPWMYGIAHHRLLDHLEKQRRWGKTELLTPAGLEELAELAGEDTRGGDHAGGVLRKALAGLSDTQRRVIQMLKLEGRSVAEISRRTGLSISTVKVTAHRGYKKLRALLSEPEP